jgi:hypothetical protein
MKPLSCHLLLRLPEIESGSSALVIVSRQEVHLLQVTWIQSLLRRKDLISLAFFQGKGSWHRNSLISLLIFDILPIHPKDPSLTISLTENIKDSTEANFLEMPSLSTWTAFWDLHDRRASMSGYMTLVFRFVMVTLFDLRFWTLPSSCFDIIGFSCRINISCLISFTWQRGLKMTSNLLWDTDEMTNGQSLILTSRIEWE